MVKKSRKINKSHFRVAIFGSARIKRGDKLYRKVYNLAKMIARREMDLVTGGGPGLMDAASAGHKKGDPKDLSHTIGLTIKLPREQESNKHLEIKEDFDKFSGRLDKFMNLSNVVVVAPGGIGTLLELFYTWQLVQVKQICHIPIILMGEEYQGLINWIKKHLLRKKYMNKEDLDFIFVVKDNKHAMRIIEKAHKEFKEKGKDYCLNFKKYKLVK